ncbi:unnamed protein product [Arctia plantaginis]|uniref:C-type lectin domain-containing protein n=1 Tax=Arctia plantaginis TaxID=874455 RepID=A0A8S0YTA8_ARCPL|nr:unnamed protein product [Arctia plantaginis]
MESYLKYLVLMFCAKFLDGVKFRCDYQYNDIGWSKYHKIPASWPDARLMCQLEGGILASPTSPELKAVMLPYIGKIDIFTGIHSTFSNGHFYHSINGIPLDKISHEWANSEPDNKNDSERCLTLNCEGKLSDVRCEEPRPYICYREHSHIDTNICGTPDPEYRFQSVTNKCYKFHTKPRSFARAHFACSAESGHLVIINSEEESKLIGEIYAKYLGKMVGNFRKDVAFIGFHNWNEGGDWMTIHGQTLQDAGFDKFTKGTPNNRTTGEYCGSILPDGLLNDLYCEEHYAFICEKSPDYPAVCDFLGQEQKGSVNVY